MRVCKRIVYLRSRWENTECAIMFCTQEFGGKTESVQMYCVNQNWEGEHRVCSIGKDNTECKMYCLHQYWAYAEYASVLCTQTSALNILYNLCNWKMRFAKLKGLRKTF